MYIYCFKIANEEGIKVVLLIIVVISFIMYKSLRHFLLFKEIKTTYHQTTISLEVFFTFTIVYCIFILGFGLIYFILSFTDNILIENGPHLPLESGLFRRLFLSLYFSGVTLLTIGYGDITPIGVGRIISLVQALLGYVLPTAFMLKLVQLHQMKDQG